jgi:ethanolamine ammonia-lyase small subunit
MSVPNSLPDKPLPQALSNYTSARINLRRTGSSLSTAEILNFQQAHAQARDAVHASLDPTHLAQRLRNELPEVLAALILQSAAPDRATYLRRPDLGRTLAPGTIINPSPADAAIILADGLSALAIDRQAIPLLRELLPLLAQSKWTLAPICIVQQARVAIADPIGAILQASLTIILIGERPGLSSPDSLGAYITWNPRPNLTDADRNCISNIRTEGLDHPTAAHRILHYCNESRRLRLSGTILKELDAPTQPILP